MRKKQSVRKRQGLGRKIWLLAGIFLLLNLILDGYFYTVYQEKIGILASVIVSGKQENLDTAVSILKGDVDLNAGEKAGDASGSSGRDVLENYGYLKGTNNAFLRRFYLECTVTAGGTLLLLLGLCGVFLLWKHRKEQEEADILAQIEQRLIWFREQKEYDVPLCGERKIVQKVDRQLESLGGYLEIIREQAFAEKEGTKALVTDISHQLKTPVAALDTCFSILMEKDLSEEERTEFALRCRKALDSLEGFLESLLQISKMETGMIQITLKEGNLLDTIVEAVESIYPKASEKEIDVSFSYGKKEETLSVMQDQKWLGEAMVNLLDNAVKYSPSGSNIKISLQRRNTMVRIEIEDQGIGIPKEEYHKIFQRFYRGNAKAVNEENGSGVGLYLAREIVERHHGLLSVSSAYEKSKEAYPGSRFVLQLPMC